MKLFFKRDVPFWLWPVLILAIGLVVFFPSLNHQFVYDDWWFIVKNPAVKHLLPIPDYFFSASTSAAPLAQMNQDVYRPLAILSFAINNAFFGLSPVSFRFFGILLHVTNACLLWVFLRRRVSEVAAFLGALLFLLHPVQVESVVWISQRSILLCAMGSLGALLAWDRSDENRYWGWGALICYVVALFSKETALGLPLVLFAMRKKGSVLPFIFMGCGYFFLRAHVLGQWSQHVNRSESLLVSLGYGMVALAHYARIVVWPVGLNVSVPATELVTLGSLVLWMGILILALTVALLMASWVRYPFISIGFVTFLVFWAPHSGIVSLITFAADRFLYLPMVGLAVLVSAVFKDRWRQGVALLIILGLGLLSVQRAMDWKDDITLWASSVRANPRNPFALACYGEALYRQGRLEEAERYFDLALQNRPTIGVARSVLSILISMGKSRGDSASVTRWEQKLQTVPK